MPTQSAEQAEKRRERERYLQRVYNRMRKGMTRQEAEAADRGTRHASVVRAEELSKKDEAIERRVALWLQAERIVAYLPRLYEQREEARRRLAELDQLIADEEAAAAAIERQVA